MTTTTDEALSRDELLDVWPLLTPQERASGFRLLERSDAEELFTGMAAREAAPLILALPGNERRSWLRLLPPDDAADVIQAAEAEDRAGLLDLLDAATRREVSALLAYAEDDAGGLMSPRFARVRPDMTVDEALSYLRRQAREQRLETMAYVYVLGDEQHLLGVCSIRELFTAPGDRRVREVMKGEPIVAGEHLDQEALSRLFADHDLLMVPVVDQLGRMRGIVTADDIVDVVEEEATEDIQKFGGVAALEAPYLEVPFLQMLKKRGGWLAILCLGEMLTATAMAFFEAELAKALVLMTFVPLIMSSGGNSGSQASTLVIRAMALGEVKLRDLPRVVRRELAAGVCLGLLLGALGFLRIEAWAIVGHAYGTHHTMVALTVFAAQIGVVMFGTLAGSVLPFLLKRLGFDPASASAPFVATLVDVTGLIIYFTAASAILSGVLL